MSLLTLSFQQSVEFCGQGMFLHFRSADFSELFRGAGESLTATLNEDKI
jgi:hypothetical protein